MGQKRVPFWSPSGQVRPQYCISGTINLAVLARTAQKGVKKGSKNGPDLVKKGVKNGPLFEPKIPHFKWGFSHIWDQKWLKNGSKMGPKNGPKRAKKAQNSRF